MQANKLTFLLLTFLPLLFSGIHLHAQTDTGWNKKKAATWFKKEVWQNAKTIKEKEIHYDNFGRVLEEDTTGSDATAAIGVLALRPDPSVNKLEFARQYNKHKEWWDKAFAYLKETNLAALTPGSFWIDSGNVLIAVTEGLPGPMDTTKWESHLLYADIHYAITGPGPFYVFFPQDPHQAHLQTESYTDKKIVIKVRITF